MEQENEYFESIPAPESIGDILFSFEGRINRARYWLYSALLFLSLVAIAIWGFLSAGDAGFWSSYTIAVVFVIWPSVALGVKRCHDRDRSGWFMLVTHSDRQYLVPH